VKWTEQILPALGIGVMATAIISVGVVIGVNSIKPPKMTWEAVSVENSPAIGEYLLVSGKQRRNESSECSNNFQADMRHDGDTEVRLPVPTRALKDDGAVKYDLVLPPDIEVGVYEIRIRETFNCGGGPEPIETPWMTFEVRGKVAE
jgi:hypothetical protein